MNAAAGAGSFLESLDREARELLLSVANPVSFTAGSTLVRHGEAARGAYVLREGFVEAAVTLPGGERLTVAKFGAGGVFGEMALIELGTCTATIRAHSNVDGWFIAHEDFRALVSQRHPAALRIQHAVTMILAEKLTALNARLIACHSPADRRGLAHAEGSDPLGGIERRQRAGFDAAAFLPRLPLFQHFMADEIEALVARARYLELPRGHAIFHARAPAQAAYVVTRGAAEIVAAEGVRMAVLGPGQIFGHLSVLREARHSAHAFAREAALLLEIPGASFRELYFGSSGAAARLRQAVQASLLASMGRTNRALTRLLSQAKLDASRAEAAELEAAYHGQLATAAH